MCHVQGNGDVWSGQIKQGVRKWNSEVAMEKEIKLKSTTTRYIYRIYKGVQVDVKLRELDEQDACRHVHHNLRMTWKITIW